jgi:sugar phosphate isomerase/epimerase
MRLGISSYTYAWAVGVPGHPPARPMGAVDLLRKAVAHAVSVVQIADNMPLHRMSGRALDTLARRARELGIAIEVGTRGIAPEHLRAYLDLARRFGSPILRVVVDTADQHPSEDEIVGALREIIGEFERARVCLAIENHDRFKAATLARIVRRVRSKAVGICLDTANSLGALEGPEAVVRTLLPMTVNLHLKDFAIRRAGHQMGFVVEGRPAGQGQLDIPWLLERLRNRGRDVNAILELWTPPEDDVRRTIAKEAEWAAESVRYLRQLIPA